MIPPPKPEDPRVVMAREVAAALRAKAVVMREQATQGLGSAAAAERTATVAEMHEEAAVRMAGVAR